MADITKRVAPLAWEAFEDYMLKSEKFSRLELKVLAQDADAAKYTREYLETFGLKGREADEFLEKVGRFRKD
jgi:hypothetical protein